MRLKIFAGFLLAITAITMMLSSFLYNDKSFLASRHKINILPKDSKLEMVAKNFLNDYSTMGLASMHAKYPGHWLETPTIPNKGYVRKYDTCQATGSSLTCFGVMQLGPTEFDLGNYNIVVNAHGIVTKFAIYRRG